MFNKDSYYTKGVNEKLIQFAEENNLRITSGTGGKHNIGSKHGAGLAIDIDHRNLGKFKSVEEMYSAAKEYGISIKDERVRPKGQAVWSAPHFHLGLGDNHNHNHQEVLNNVRKNPYISEVDTQRLKGFSDRFNDPYLKSLASAFENSGSSVPKLPAVDRNAILGSIPKPTVSEQAKQDIYGSWLKDTLKTPVPLGYAEGYEELNKALNNQPQPFAKNHPILANVIGIGTSIALPVIGGIAGSAVPGVGTAFGAGLGSASAGAINNKLQTGKLEQNIPDTLFNFGAGFVGARVQGLGALTKNPYLKAAAAYGLGDDAAAQVFKSKALNIGAKAVATGTSNLAYDAAVGSGFNALDIKNTQGEKYSVNELESFGVGAGVSLGLSLFGLHGVNNANKTLDKLNINKSNIPSTPILDPINALDDFTAINKANQIEEGNTKLVERPELAQKSDNDLVSELDKTTKSVKELTIALPTDSRFENLNRLISKYNKAQDTLAKSQERINKYRTEAQGVTTKQSNNKYKLIDERVISKNEREIEMAYNDLSTFYKNNLGDGVDVDTLIKTHQTILKDSKLASKQIQSLTTNASDLNTEITRRKNIVEITNNEIVNEQRPEINNNPILFNEVPDSALDALSKITPDNVDDSKALGIIEDYLNDIKTIKEQPRHFVNNVLEALQNNNKQIGLTRKDINKVLSTDFMGEEPAQVRALRSIVKTSIGVYPELKISSKLRNDLEQVIPGLVEDFQDASKIKGQTVTIDADEQFLDFNSKKTAQLLRSVFDDVDDIKKVNDLYDGSNSLNFRNSVHYKPAKEELIASFRKAAPQLVDAELDSISDIAFAIIAKRAKNDGISFNEAYSKLTIGSLDEKGLPKGDTLFSKFGIDTGSSVINTPEFQKWFAGSKIVDDNGTAMVLYHGTNKNFDVFKNGELEKASFFTTERGIADTYANNSAIRTEGKGANVKPVFLNIRNPKELDFAGNDFYDSGIDIVSEIELAKAQGHDGMILKNVMDLSDNEDGFGMQSQYLTFNPEQVKSAIGNTKFNPNNPSILESKVGNVIRGAYNVDSNSILLSKDANAFTVVHELAHYYEATMSASEKAAVLKWAGHTDWSVDTSEKFARGFEKYLATKKAPTPLLQKVFKAFANFALELIDGLSEKNIKLNDSISKVYSNMLSEASPRYTEEVAKYNRILAESKKAGANKDEYSIKIEDQKNRINIAKVADSMERQFGITVKDDVFTPVDANYNHINRLSNDTADVTLNEIAESMHPNEYIDLTTGLPNTATQVITQIHSFKERLESDVAVMLDKIKGIDDLEASNIIKNNPELADLILRRRALDLAIGDIIKLRKAGTQRSISFEWQALLASFEENYEAISSGNDVASKTINKALTNAKLRENTKEAKEAFRDYLTGRLNTMGLGQRRVDTFLLEPLGSIVKRMKDISKEMTNINPLEYLSNVSNLSLISKRLSETREGFAWGASAISVENMLAVAGWGGINSNMSRNPVVSLASGVNSIVGQSVIHTQVLNGLQAFANGSLANLAQKLTIEDINNPISKLSPSDNELLKSWGFDIKDNFNFNPFSKKTSFNGLGYRDIETPLPLSKIESRTSDTLRDTYISFANYAVRLAVANNQRGIAENAMIATKQYLSAKGLETNNSRMAQKTFNYFYTKLADEGKSGVRAFLSPGFTGNAALIDPRVWGIAVDRFIESTYDFGGSLGKSVAMALGSSKAVSTRFTSWLPDEFSKQINNLNLFKKAIDNAKTKQEKVSMIGQALGAYSLYGIVFGARATVPGAIMSVAYNAINSLLNDEKPDNSLAEYSLLTAFLPNWVQSGFQPMSSEKASASPTAVLSMLVNSISQNGEAFKLASAAFDGFRSLGNDVNYSDKLELRGRADSKFKSTIYGTKISSAGDVFNNLIAFTDQSSTKTDEDKLIDFGYSILEFLSGGLAKGLKSAVAMENGYLSVGKDASLSDIKSHTLNTNKAVNMSPETFKLYNENYFVKLQFLICNSILGLDNTATQEYRRNLGSQFSENDPIKNVANILGEL